MQTLFPASILAFALTFTAGSFAVAYSQQLQSDGTVSKPQQAQRMHKHAHNAAHESKHLSKRLGLTPDQSAQLQPILADRNARLAALHADSTLAPGAMHKQSHAIHQEFDGKINALLTPAQQQLYSDMRAARHHRGGGGAPSAAL